MLRVLIGPLNRINLSTRHRVFLKNKDIQISMDGNGCWRGNVFVEREWQSVKYDAVYLHAYDTVIAPKQGLAGYVTFSNSAARTQRLTGEHRMSSTLNTCPSCNTQPRQIPAGIHS
jgi:hypothetical protein